MGEVMYLQECLECQHGGNKEKQSHCRREAVYSQLTNCINLIRLVSLTAFHKTSPFLPSLNGSIGTLTK